MYRVLLVTVMSFFTAFATAAMEDNAITQAFGRSGEGSGPIVITSNRGGEIKVFQKAGEEIKKSGRLFVVDGLCASACAMVAAFVRPNACITEEAKFLIHTQSERRTFGKPNRAPSLIIDIRGFDPQPISPDIKAWVEKKGTFSHKGELMSFEEALNFWPLCS